MNEFNYHSSFFYLYGNICVINVSELVAGLKEMSEKHRILVVDDEPDTRFILKAALTHEGYDVSLASNGQEAFTLLEESVPDVILLDVMMPGMTGFEVCQLLKTDSRWQHIPIILVTALAGKRDLARGLEAGADDFVHKPVHNLELRSRVRSMLRIKKAIRRRASNLAPKRRYGAYDRP